MNLPKVNAIEKYVVPLVAGAVGVATELISLGLVHGTPLAVATAVVSVASSVGVYYGKYQPKAAAPAAVVVNPDAAPPAVPPVP
jgi:hypothetical protein